MPVTVIRPAISHGYGLSYRAPCARTRSRRRLVNGRSHRAALGPCDPDRVRSLTIASSFARFDALMQREFEVRRKMAAEWDRRDMFAGYALFLFSPRFTREHPERVAEWIDRATNSPTEAGDREISLKRIDMIATHDALPRLGHINKPTLVICGDRNLCTPLPLSEEIAQAVPGAKLVVLQDAGELIELEKPEQFFKFVSTFITKHSPALGRQATQREALGRSWRSAARLLTFFHKSRYPMTTYFKIPTSDGSGEIPLYVAEPEGKPRAALLGRP